MGLDITAFYYFKASIPLLSFKHTKGSIASVGPFGEPGADFDDGA